MLITSEQIGQSIFLKVMSFTVKLAPHEPQVTDLCGAGIAGNGKAPGAGGIGNSPGGGGAGKGGKPSKLGKVGTGNSSSGGSSPGGGIGGKFFDKLSNISLASRSFFLS